MDNNVKVNTGTLDGQMAKLKTARNKANQYKSFLGKATSAVQKNRSDTTRALGGTMQNMRDTQIAKLVKQIDALTSDLNRVKTSAQQLDHQIKSKIG